MVQDFVCENVVISKFLEGKSQIAINSLPTVLTQPKYTGLLATNEDIPKIQQFCKSWDITFEVIA